MTAGIVFAFNLYLKDLLTDEGHKTTTPRRLRTVEIMAVTEMILVVISQFTNMYYYFDEMNRYHRGPLFLLSYVIPVVAPMIQFSVIQQYRKLISRLIYISLILFIFVPIFFAIVQIWTYGLSLVNIAMVFVAIGLYVFAYLDINEKVERANKLEIEYLKNNRDRTMKMFDQTSKAFVNAVDARNIHTQGHSERVALYSKRIAEMCGKNEEECENIYYSALLHDVGKIGMPDSIVKKDGELSAEEFEEFKQKPVIGNQILSQIEDFPYLSDGAHYHCERYDGKGYPEGLKGDRIPEIARIVAVADAYDMMSSRNSQRDPLPQYIVREEIIKGSGVQFDPSFAGAMLQLMDTDNSYQMKSDAENVDTSVNQEFTCTDYRSVISYGIQILEEVTRIRFRAVSTIDGNGGYSAPSVILFDAYDGRVHETERSIRDTRFIEYGELWFDGHTISTGARNMETKVSDTEIPTPVKDNTIYEIESLRQKDHVRIRMYNSGKTVEVTAALPDSSRYAYISLTGENCRISDIEITNEGEPKPEDAIPRIADEVSYINRLESDIPNIQINNNRSDHTRGIEITDGMSLTFHTVSLPAANLVWHCPYIVIFSSDDGLVNGENYTEYSLVRLDGEIQESSEAARNETVTEKNEGFSGWNDWKEFNKKGYESTVYFRRSGNRIVTETENAAIHIKNTTVVNDRKRNIFASITGDMCAITDIRIRAKS